MEGPTFKRIYVEITNVCNQACPFCPGTARAPQFISEDDFSLILTKLQGHTGHLYFHVLGEPLLHPKIGTFLEKAHDRGFLVNLVTNGTLINQVGHSLREKPALRQISFSLHGLAHLNEETALKHVQNILEFIDADYPNHFYSSLRLWAGGVNENLFILRQLSEYYSLDHDLLVHRLKQNPLQGIHLKEKVFLNPADEFVWPSLQGKIQHGQAFCLGLNQQLAILVDGTVVPCCLDGEGIINLGNIYQESLGEIYSKERCQNIIKAFSQGYAVEELCKRCGYRSRFSK
ncbi:MAG: SPASM domain-containing protein [Bacillota bacterium]|nr:SPASM domain-containing protein [Bacillota bacterium]